MFNGEMSCRPRSQHPAPGPGYQIQTSARAPPPGPEGAGLRNTGPFPGRLPARPGPGPRGSPRLPKPEPGHSQSHPRAGGGGGERREASRRNYVNSRCQKESARPCSPTAALLAAGGLGDGERARGPEGSAATHPLIRRDAAAGRHGLRHSRVGPLPTPLAS